jgi:hypothetical protein
MIFGRKSGYGSDDQTRIAFDSHGVESSSTPNPDIGTAPSMIFVHRASFIRCALQELFLLERTDGYHSLHPARERRRRAQR